MKEIEIQRKTVLEQLAEIVVRFYEQEKRINELEARIRKLEK